MKFINAQLETLQSKEKIQEFYDDIEYIESFLEKEKINIPRVIADRYRLINYKITDTDINSNLSNFIDIILKLQIIEYMEELNLDYGDILFLVNVKSRSHCC